MNRALIIKQPWIELILSGQKTWEMRSRPTNVRGRIGLIVQGTGLIVGEVDITDCLAPLTEKEMHHSPYHLLHMVDEIELLKKWRYAWVLKNAKRYKKPIPYNHPQGAVTWVRLDDDKLREQSK